jgi:NarL family two-component system response regulator LiaR
MISVFLIDDHPLAVTGIGKWLHDTRRFTISGAAGTLEDARDLLEELDSLPEIVILDVLLGKEDGLDFIPMLKEICKKKHTDLPGILVCSMYEDPFLIQRAMDLGARAYVSKTAELWEIITAIDAMLAGNTYINPRYKIQAQEHDLTPQENKIIFLLKQSLSNQQIAERLELSVRTVENHLAHIYKKTKITSRDKRDKLFKL